MQAQSTAASYKPCVALTGKRGWYRVQSSTNPSVYYETSANSCTCPARKPCKHQAFVRSLNAAFFVMKEAAPPTAVTLPAAAFASGWDDGNGDTGPVWREAPATSTLPATTSGHCTVCGEHDHYLRAGLCVLCEADASEIPAATPTPPVSDGLDAELTDAEWLLTIKRLALTDAHPQDDSYATLLRQVDQAERAVATANYSAMRAA